MKNVFVSDHPLVLDKVARLRDRRTNVADFRRVMGEISMLLGHEALAEAKLKKVRVRTPLGVCESQALAQDLVFVAILRAGLGLIEGLTRLAPEAKLAHIGLYRDEETLRPVNYYVRFPSDISSSFVLLADPMLATGGSAVEAVNILKARGAKKIAFVCLIASKEGLRKLASAHPDVPIYVATVDERLNGDGYIMPGLGDAGDRMFGTN
ncbi:MAG: uracil phosphoribosyltransferase [Elusimicrobiales bacterium]|jgi:uracil phosphoribosyltransferase|nr:uracil phosphoribosyltransferase [Elusimicrobiales bacterium]